MSKSPKILLSVQNKESLMERVKGLDGTEISTIAKHYTFCNLCYKEVFEGEEAITWPGRKFLIHPDCQDPKVKKRKTSMQFRKTSKKRTSVKQGTNRGKTSNPSQSRKNWS